MAGPFRSERLLATCTNPHPRRVPQRKQETQRTPPRRTAPVDLGVRPQAASSPPGCAIALTRTLERVLAEIEATLAEAVTRARDAGRKYIKVASQELSGES